MESQTQDLPIPLLWIIAPTRAIFDCKLLGRIPISHWSWLFLALNAVLLFLLPSPEDIPQLPGRLLVWLIMWAIPYSRIVEIGYAFYNDSFDQLAGKLPRSGLTRVDRLKLAGRSYVEVAICYGILFRGLPANYYNHPTMTRFDWLYFSWITITTTGYGEVVPTRVATRALCMTEVAMGLMLLVFSVGTYFSYREPPCA
jgi:hypothetical protein